MRHEGRNESKNLSSSAQLLPLAKFNRREEDGDKGGHTANTEAGSQG